MEFSVPGFIKRYCTPNALLTLAEYLIDYATPDVKKGWQVIQSNLKNVESEDLQKDILKKIEEMKQGKRDLYY